MQTQLEHPFFIRTEDFTDVVCEQCAIDFAKMHGLTWVGGKAYESSTEYDSEYDSPDKPQAWDGFVFYDFETDTPPSCCDTYLYARLTKEGVEYLKDNFPDQIVRLYLGEV